MTDDKMREALTDDDWQVIADESGCMVPGRLKEAIARRIASRARPVDAPTDAERLTDYIASHSEDFVSMEWSGNEYTGEGVEYPRVSRAELLAVVRAAMRATPADGGEG